MAKTPAADKIKITNSKYAFELVLVTSRPLVVVISSYAFSVLVCMIIYHQPLSKTFAWVEVGRDLELAWRLWLWQGSCLGVMKWGLKCILGGIGLSSVSNGGLSIEVVSESLKVMHAAFRRLVI